MKRAGVCDSLDFLIRKHLIIISLHTIFIDANLRLL